MKIALVISVLPQQQQQPMKVRKKSSVLTSVVGINNHWIHSERWGDGGLFHFVSCCLRLMLMVKVRACRRQMNHHWKNHPEHDDDEVEADEMNWFAVAFLHLRLHRLLLLHHLLLFCAPTSAVFPLPHAPSLALFS